MDVNKLVDVCVAVGVDVKELVGVCVAVGVFVDDGIAFVVPSCNPSRLFPASPQALPSKKSAELKLQTVALPKDVGVQIKTSSPAPAIPFTANAPAVER